MTISLADFKQRVGFRLGVIRSTESLKAQDAALVLAAYTSLWEELDAAGLVDFYVEDPIPDQYGDILIGMTAARLVDDFGVEEPRKTSILIRMSYGNEIASLYERRLRRMAQVGPKDEPVASEYF